MGQEGNEAEGEEGGNEESRRDGAEEEHDGERADEENSWSFVFDESAAIETEAGGREQNA